jgi:hypothetical protein
LQSKLYVTTTNFYLMCVVIRIVYIVKYGALLWHNCFCCPVVIELEHFDPSVNQNTRAPIAMKLCTQKDGCLQINASQQSPSKCWMSNICCLMPTVLSYSSIATATQGHTTTEMLNTGNSFFFLFHYYYTGRIRKLSTSRID